MGECREKGKCYSTTKETELLPLVGEWVEPIRLNVRSQSQKDKQYIFSRTENPDSFRKKKKKKKKRDTHTPYCIGQLILSMGPALEFG